MNFKATYQKIKSKIKKIKTNTPIPTPTAIHLVVSLLSGTFVGSVVGDVVVGVEGDWMNASTREMLAPRAVSISDLYVLTMLTSVFPGNMDVFPMKRPRGCWT